MITEEQLNELMNASQITNDISKMYESYLNDAYKFYVKNNSSAGTRARKSLMSMKQLIINARQDIQSIKNNK